MIVEQPDPTALPDGFLCVEVVVAEPPAEPHTAYELHCADCDAVDIYDHPPTANDRAAHKHAAAPDLLGPGNLAAWNRGRQRANESMAAGAVAMASYVAPPAPNKNGQVQFGPRAT